MVRTLVRCISLFLLSAALITQSSIGGEKLRYQMTKGDTYKYKLTTENKTNIQQGGQDMTILAKSLFGISVSVQDVGKEGNMTLVAKVDTNRTNIDSPMMKDSAMVFKEINGKRTRVLMSPLGKTLKTTPIDTIKPSQTMMMLGGANVADMMHRLFMILPEEELTVGGTWKRNQPDTTNTQGIRLVTKPETKYTLAGSEKVGGFDCLKIVFEGTASQYGTGTVQGMEIVFDGSVKTKGTAYFAPKEGVLVSIESSTTNQATVSGTGEQMFTRNQSTSSTSKMMLVN